MDHACQHYREGSGCPRPEGYGLFPEKGYSLVDDHGNEVDPATVDWSKYHKRVFLTSGVQGSGG